MQGSGGWEDSDEEVTYCGFCEEAKAVVLCRECEDYFCAPCSNKVHRTCLRKHTLSRIGKPLPESADPVAEEEAKKAPFEAWAPRRVKWRRS